MVQIKKQLQKLDKDKLIDLISELYKKDKFVKEFLSFQINQDEKGLFEKYRNKVYEAYFPKRGYKLKLREAKQAISEFKKFNPPVQLVADLMLFYVETGVKFSNEFGDIDEKFYLSLANTYNAALKFIQKENLLESFADRAGCIVSDSSHFGWGFHDDLRDIYDEFYVGK